MTDTPSEIIAELRELMGRATKGPWHEGTTPMGAAVELVTTAGCAFDDEGCPRAYSSMKRPDAALIVATHSALPTLLALLDEAVGALEDVVNPLDHARRLAEADGCQLSGEAYQVCNSLNYVQQIARAVLAKIKETQ